MRENTLKLIFVFLIQCIACNSYEQNVKIDSINKILKNHNKDDTIKAKLLIQLAKSYQSINLDSAVAIDKRGYFLAEEAHNSRVENSALIMLSQIYIYKDDYESALKYDKTALALGNQTGNKQDQGHAYIAICSDYYWLQQYQEAISYADSGLSLLKTINDTAGIAEGYYTLGNVYGALENYQQALDFSLKALKLYESQHISIGMFGCYNRIGGIYCSLDDYDNGLISYNSALAISKQMQDTVTSIGIRINIGGVYMQLKNYAKALENFVAGLDFAQKTQDLSTQNICLNNIGEVCFKIGDHERAKQYYERALSGFIQLKNTAGICAAYINIGQLEILKKQTEEHGIVYLKSGLDMAISMHNKQYIVDAAQSLAGIYKQRKEYANALQFNEIFHDYTDSLNKDAVSKHLQQLQFNYELDKKENKISQLEKDNTIKQQKGLVKSFIVIALIIGVLILIIFSISRVRKNKLISGQKEEIQQQAANLRELNVFKDKILSILSHDLHSPIASVRSGISLMDIDADISPEDMRFIREQMEQQLDSMSMLVDNLLQWASSSQNTAQNAAIHLDIFKLSETSIHLLQNTANTKNITIKNNISQDVKAKGNYNQVNTVIRNLLANAIKFTPENGTITLAASQIDEVVTISVSDSGIGMTGDQIEKLFTRDKSSTYGTNGEKGIGLGLAICKEFVEANDGTISVTSRLNEGSTFSIILPATDI